MAGSHSLEVCIFGAHGGDSGCYLLMMIYHFSPLNRCGGAWALLLALTGCPKDQPSETDGDTSTGSTNAATTAATTTATTTATTPTSGTGEAGETGAMSVCHEACLHLTACGNQLLAPSMAACVSLCEGSVLIDTEWCETAARDWYACLGAAPCEEVQPGPFGACAVPFADYSVSCTPCFASIEPDTAERCFATADCTGGFAVSFACEGDTCSCELDGEVFATCPAAGACAIDDAAIQAAAESCCEMPFTPFMNPGG